MKFKKFLAFTSVALVAVQAVQASTGVAPLDTVLRLLTGFFTIPSIKNLATQVALIRFGIFLVVFSACYAGLSNAGTFKGRSNSRISGTIALVVAVFGAFLMPEKLIMLTGGTIAAIVTLAVAFGALIAGAIYAMKLNKSWVQHLGGLLILIAVACFLSFYASFLGFEDVGIGTGASSGSGSSGNVQASPGNSAEGSGTTTIQNNEDGTQNTEPVDDSNLDRVESEDLQESAEVAPGGALDGEPSAPNQDAFVDNSELDRKEPGTVGTSQEGRVQIMEASYISPEAFKKAESNSQGPTINNRYARQDFALYGDTNPVGEAEVGVESAGSGLSDLDAETHVMRSSVSSNGQEAYESPTPDDIIQRLEEREIENGARDNLENDPGHLMSFPIINFEEGGS